MSVPYVNSARTRSVTVLSSGASGGDKENDTNDGLINQMMGPVRRKKNSAKKASKPKARIWDTDAEGNVIHVDIDA